MSFLTQNINTVKEFKKNIDKLGNSWASEFMQHTVNVLFSIPLMKQGYNTLVLTFDVIGWKTAIVEIDSNTFCLALDLNKSTKCSVDLVFPIEFILKEYKDKTNVKFYNNYFSVSNEEQLKAKLADLEEYRQTISKDLDNITYSFIKDGTDSPFTLKLINKAFKDNLKYFPLVFVCLDTNVKYYNLYYLSKDNYMSAGNNPIANLSSVLQGNYLASMIVIKSSCMGLRTHIAVDFSGSIYKFKS